MTDATPESIAQVLNETIVDGWARAMGVRFLRASKQEVIAEVDIGPEHRQPYGIVHGGVHCGLIETIASVGAAIVAIDRGQSVVGLDNHTTFLRAARGGKLIASAVPVVTGRRTQVWDGEVRDTDGRLLASGRVRLLCLDPGAELAGETAGPQQSTSLGGQAPGAPSAGPDRRSPGQPA
jgi:1,4-dihydroxy-2-naphthoyl-CoA hydrolase